MTLQLEIVSEHRDLVGDDAVCVFENKGGTIGRSLQSDWILPDPDRYVSGRHATIDYQGGAYYVADTSSNGVYMNGDCEPIGRGNPRRLFNGDVIRLGNFVINVTIDEGEGLAMPADRPGSSSSDHANSRVDEEEQKSSMLLLDEEALTGDDEFQSALFGGNDDARDGQAAENDPMTPPESAADDRDEAKPAVRDAAAQDDLIEAFMEGLGISRTALHADYDLRDIMKNAGEVLREYVEGTTELLASRANMKNSLQLEQTIVLPRNNNPLKLSVNRDDSIRQLLVGKEGEYLGPRDAVRGVCRDLLFHQDAFIDAMNSAFMDFADQFDPDELQSHFDRALGEGMLARLLGKFKYWEMYVELYPSLVEKDGDRIPQSLSEEFVRAYEQQIAEYKRLGGIDDSLKDTVDLDKTDYNPAGEFQPDPDISAELDAINESPFELDDLVEAEPFDASENR